MSLLVEDGESTPMAAPLTAAEAAASTTTSSSSPSGSRERWRRRMPIMIFAIAQSYASCGTQAIMYNYFREILLYGDDQATFYTSVFIVAYNLCGIFGGVLADKWSGKYWTQLWTSAAWLGGTVLLLVSTLDGFQGEDHVGSREALALAGLLLMTFAYGAQQPSQVAFVGDQADLAVPGDISELFSWFYFAQNVGALFGEGGCPLLREHVSFWVTFTTVLAAQGVGLLVILAGKPGFVILAAGEGFREGDDIEEVGDPTKSLLGSSAAHGKLGYGATESSALLIRERASHHEVLPHGSHLPDPTAAASSSVSSVSSSSSSGGGGIEVVPAPRHRSRGSVNGRDDAGVSEPLMAGATKDGGPLDAAVFDPEPCCTCCGPVCAPSCSKLGYSDADARSIRRVLLILSVFPIFWALYYQQSNTFIDQTSQMNTAIIWDTTDILAGFNDLLVCIFIPLFGSVIYPFLDRTCYAMTPLRKIGWGMLSAALTFVCAGLVQTAIKNAPDGSVNVAWQAPQYVFISISETMVAVTGLEFAYSQCTHNTRSLVQSFWNAAQFGQILPGLAALFQIADLEAQFFFYAGLMGASILVYLVIAHRFQYVAAEDRDRFLRGLAVAEEDERARKEATGNPHEVSAAAYKCVASGVLDPRLG